MRTVNEEARQAKKIELMEKCYDCYAENGLSGVGIKTIAKACGCNAATLYLYFENLDDLIIKSTAYCMAKVEDDFKAGIGLNLSKLIIEAHHGSIKAGNSEKYGGAEFVVTLPMYRLKTKYQSM